jgi:hypothetical protein
VCGLDYVVEVEMRIVSTGRMLAAAVAGGFF